MSDGADIGADGLIGRKVIGKGVAVFCQLDPDRFQADEKITLRLPPAASDAAAHPDPGITLAAHKLVGENVPVEAWIRVTLPGMLPFFKANDGEAVFRKEIVVPRSAAGKDMILALGAIDDFDNTYFNGVEIGHTDVKTATWWLARRNYVVPGRLVKAGGVAR